jgi:hypothetical protein
LLGRKPDVDERGREGILRLSVIDGSSRLVSRAHLAIMLQYWDFYLVDAGTASGALVAMPAAQGYSALVLGRPLRLSPRGSGQLRQSVFHLRVELAR